MKIAILNDTHFGIRNASNVFADNAEKFFSTIFFPYMLANNITHIIHLGDYYDSRKYISVKTMNNSRKVFLDKLREHNISMDIFPGNHDTFYKNTNEVNSLKELLGYYKDVVNIFMDPTVNDYDGCKIGLLPWICNENYDESLSFISKAKCDILCGHLDLTGFPLLRGVINTHGMDHKLFSKFEMVLSGHFHTKSQHDNIHYLGAQMEFFWSDANDPKYFHILDTSNRELKPIRNTNTLFLKLYYDDDTKNMLVPDCDNKFVKVIVEKKLDPFKFDRYIKGIQDQKIHDLKIVESFEEFVGENIADSDVMVENTGVLLDSYIEAVQTDLDKNRLKKSMQALLIEAEAFEIV
jgi:DNA repair exonuclease SbcCD nuclease subunit